MSEVADILELENDKLQLLNTVQLIPGTFCESICQLFVATSSKTSNIWFTVTIYIWCFYCKFLQIRTQVEIQEASILVRHKIFDKQISTLSLAIATRTTE